MLQLAQLFCKKQVLSAGIIENIPWRQGGTRPDGHQNHSNKARWDGSIDVKENKIRGYKTVEINGF